MTKIAESANSVDLDEVAHYEPPHLDLHCLPFSLWILSMIKLGLNIFWKFADDNFVVCFSVAKELRRKTGKNGNYFRVIWCTKRAKRTDKGRSVFLRVCSIFNTDNLIIDFVHCSRSGTGLYYMLLLAQLFTKVLKVSLLPLNILIYRTQLFKTSLA